MASHVEDSSFYYLFSSTNYVILRSCVMDLFLASVHTWQEHKDMFVSLSFYPLCQLTCFMPLHHT